MHLVKLLLCFFPGLCLANELMVVANPQAPYKYLVNKQPAGIDIEVMDTVLKQLGIPYKVKFVTVDSRIHAMAQNGSADILLLFSKKKDREYYLSYPKQSYIDISWNFFIRKEDKERIKFSQYSDLKSLKVGATKNIAYTPEFWSAKLDLDIIPNNHLQIKKLLNSRIDTVPLNTINTLFEGKGTYMIDLTYLPKAIKKKPYYNVFSKASRHPKMNLLKRQYDDIILNIKNNGTLDKITKKYLGKNI